VAVAFDKNTGKEIWKALTAKDPGYSPPSIIEAGGKRQLLIWHPEAINSLDPESGKEYWSVPLKPMYGMSIMTPRKFGDYLYAGGIGEVSLLLKLAKEKPAAEEVCGEKRRPPSTASAPRRWSTTTAPCTASASAASSEPSNWPPATGSGKP